MLSFVSETINYVNVSWWLLVCTCGVCPEMQDCVCLFLGLPIVLSLRVTSCLCTQERHGQDHPVKPVSDRGLLGRKV